jgi:hypothetical protein
MRKPHIKYQPILKVWLCGDWQPNTNRNWHCSSGITPTEAYISWYATKVSDYARVTGRLYRKTKGLVSRLVC